MKSTVIAWIAALGLAAPGLAADAALSQRVWLERTVPDDAALAALRAAGVDGVVLPVGEVAVAEKNCRLTLAPLPDLRPLAGWSVSPLVWVSGEGEAAGGAEAFLTEFAPVQRLLEGGGTLVLAARAGWPGLVRFAEEVAEQRRATVEVARVGNIIFDSVVGDAFCGYFCDCQSNSLAQFKSHEQTVARSRHRHRRDHAEWLSQ